MAKLQRKLTRFDLTMIAIGSTIGSGIFATPGDIATALPASGWIIVVWAVGALVAMSGALTFAELSSTCPEAGGVYAFLKNAYGPLFGFLYGWANLLVITTGAIAALSMVFSEYLLYVLKTGGIELGGYSQHILAIGGILMVTLINIRGVKAGGIFSNVFTLLKLLGIAGLIIVGLLFVNQNQLDLSAPFDLNAIDLSQVKVDLPENRTLWTGFSAALVGVFWSFGGWQHASYLASETIDPKRSVSRAMVVGVIVIGSTYLLANLAYMRILPMEKIMGDKQLAATAMEVVLGTSGGVLIALAIFISTFGTTGIYTLTAPRIYHAMAEDGVFFKGIAKIHPVYETPMNAILLQSVWSIALIMFWGTFENLIKYVVFTDWIFMTMAAMAVFIFRAKMKGSEKTIRSQDSYRTPLFPLPPLIFIVISSWFLVTTLIGEPVQALAGLGLLAIGVGVFFFWKK